MHLSNIVQYNILVTEVVVIELENFVVVLGGMLRVKGYIMFHQDTKHGSFQFNQTKINAYNNQYIHSTKNQYRK